MPTACLNDRQIRPTECRKWRDALNSSIPRDGLKPPLTLGGSERYTDGVYVADGHHRAIALIDLGTLQWYRARPFDVDMEQRPFPNSTLGL